MTAVPAEPDLSAAFARAIADVHDIVFRDDLAVREIPAPPGLAPEALALAADVRPPVAHEDSPYGTGRLILLHDPAEPEEWGGPWRLVCFAQAPLETEIGRDPLLLEVAWSWLVDALDQRGAGYHSPSGTATKTLSTGFGGLADEGDGAQIELRASWSPAPGPFGPHVDAWAELLCMLAGLPPGSEDVALFATRKEPRG
ncbi:DUF3000 domain-containing protein [Microbacterium sp. LRZ72]|uniref:DUF3000 domain-containing protein n=1 Tax=Microbacterium sp. LRZ72 TaxID=2942481 RepID=UPI0029A74453|nr:DUF3000 domain-containing protein [Microbacterium sp. LRZ72]MDX2375350.1 DUF3000 domain-containing protein [Microbacterium sp. LRZ72]